MAISKVILNGVTQMDVTQKTVTAGSMLDGATALKNDGTDITGNIASKSSTDLTVSGATVTAPAGYYSAAASKSVASGTAGTPTATKGTVSNHSVSITPSVTNTTGYITGGTKSGTAVTVSASELVSGTKTITENGTGIDVAQYANVDVSVSGGGGGLEYEIGTITFPNQLNSNQNISFSNTHTSLPVFCSISDSGQNYNESAVLTQTVVLNELYGCTPLCNSTIYGYMSRVVANSSGNATTSVVAFTYPVSNTGNTSASYPRYYVTEDHFTLAGSASYQIGGTYKWIAVWAPST